MMKLEKQVTSLELSKKLKELGVKQDSLFYWMENITNVEPTKIMFYKDTESYKRTKKVEGGGVIKYFSAFTASELWEILPDVFKHKEGYLHRRVLSGSFQYCIGDEVILTQSGFTLPDMMGKMLMYLIKNKLIEI